MTTDTTTPARKVRKTPAERVREAGGLTYALAAAMLRKRDSLRLENNTTLERRPDYVEDARGFRVRSPEGRPMESVRPPAFAVRLHATDIATFYPDGTVELRGLRSWNTLTTRDRLNRYSPARVSSTHGHPVVHFTTWHPSETSEHTGATYPGFFAPSCGTWVPYSEGMRVTAKGIPMRYVSESDGRVGAWRAMRKRDAGPAMRTVLEDIRAEARERRKARARWRAEEDKRKAARLEMMTRECEPARLAGHAAGYALAETTGGAGAAGEDVLATTYEDARETMPMRGPGAGLSEYVIGFARSTHPVGSSIGGAPSLVLRYGCAQHTAESWRHTMRTRCAQHVGEDSAPEYAAFLTGVLDALGERFPGLVPPDPFAKRGGLYAPGDTHTLSGQRIPTPGADGKGVNP